MRSPFISALAVLATATLALAGCSGGTSGVGSDPGNPDQVEAITWWASGVEKTALDELVDVFEIQNPDIEFIDASVRGANGANARRSIAARLDAGNPPDTFQAVAGAGLTDHIAAGDLQDLTGFYADNGLTEVYRAALLELLTVDGKIYSVPSEIHRVNVVWANDDLLTSAGIDPAVPPANLDAWIDDLDRVRDSGVEFPLALGNDLTQVQLFENVLIADLGAVLYQNLWTSASNWEGDRFRTAVAHYERLLDFVDPGTGSQPWSDATQQVIGDDAAYVVMADYAVSSFQLADLNTGKKYSAFPTPGTVGVFDFFADSFTLPVGAVHEVAAQSWLLTVASYEGQKALSLVKGSIPARTDTVAEDYPPYQQTAIASLRSDTVVPSLAHGVAANPGWTDAITAAVVKFGNDAKPEALINALVAAAHDHLG